MTKDVQKMRELAERAIPLLNKYYNDHGNYPCRLQDIMGQEAVEFDKVAPWGIAEYLPTGFGYYLMVHNPGGTSVIHWGTGQSQIEWTPCPSSERCPVENYARCCDQQNSKCAVSY
jgi:hypothetical protein